MTESKSNSEAARMVMFDDIAALGNLMRELRFENRYFLSERSAKFVNATINYARKFKTASRCKGSVFYRARIHDFGMKDPKFGLAQMGAPPPDLAGNGRLNPQGIPYLYLADSIDTAVAEKRPWIDCEVTVAEFEFERELSFISFSSKDFGGASSKSLLESKEYANAEAMWCEFIVFMFSHPFDPRDDLAYVATQLIAERIKKENFDGIIYDSALAEGGYNLALYNPANAVARSRRKVKVRGIKYEIDEVATNAVQP